MRSIICIVIMLALIGLTGCAKKDPAPAGDTETQTETAVIATEDFESGEVEGVVEGVVEVGDDAIEEIEEVVEEAPDGVED